MRKILYSMLILTLLTVVAACDPVVNEIGIGKSVTSGDQIDAVVTSVVVNGKKSNKVLVKCTSPVTTQWTDGVNTLKSTEGELILVVPGNQTITFTGMAADGTIYTKEFSVVVEDMAFPVPPVYGWLFGTGEKTWVWNPIGGWVVPEGDVSGPLIMSGGAPESGRDYWGWNPDDMSAQCAEKGYPDEGMGSRMVFSLQGKTVTKYSPIGAEVGKGSISFDMTPTKVYASLGTLTFSGTNILFPYDRNGIAPWTFNKFTIAYLDNDHLMLFTPSSNGGWYYVFNAE